MRRQIRELLAKRKLEIALKELEGPRIKEDLSIFLKAAFYEKVPSGRYKDFLAVEALPLLFRDAVFGITGLSKEQVKTIVRVMDQYLGRGEVAAEQKEIAGELGPKVVYVAGQKKAESKTIDAEVLPPRLEKENVSGNQEPEE